MSTLILGCSYADTDTSNWHNQLFTDYKVYAKGGVDNAWITRTGVHALVHNQFDSVFVMFTGLNRTSLPVPKDFVPDYYHSFPVGYDQGPYSELHLIQSGGLGGTWNTQLDSKYKYWFKQQYATSSKTYFTDMNMFYVITFLSFLKSYSIDYKWTFIYNIFSNKETEHEHVLGRCTSTRYLDLLDKTNYIPITPYELAIDNNLMQADGFHPSSAGWSLWAKEVKKYL